MTAFSVIQIANLTLLSFIVFIYLPFLSPHHAPPSSTKDIVSVLTNYYKLILATTAVGLGAIYFYLGRKNQILDARRDRLNELRDILRQSIHECEISVINLIYARPNTTLELDALRHKIRINFEDYVTNLEQFTTEFEIDEEALPDLVRPYSAYDTSRDLKESELDAFLRTNFKDLINELRERCTRAKLGIIKLSPKGKAKRPNVSLF